MPLQRSTVAPTTTPSNTPFHMAGNVLQDYGVAALAEKTAKSRKEELAIVIKQTAVALYNSAAVAAARAGRDIPASIKLKDDSESVVEFQSKNAYGKLTAESVEAACEALGADVNEYFVEVPAVMFDTRVFNNADGSFSEERFALFQNALTTVAACLNIPSPLSVTNTVVPLPTFHARRYRDFAAAQQEVLAESVPNTTALTVKTLVEPAPIE